MNQSDLADLLHLAGRDKISKCWNGKAILDNESYIILSKEWGIRFEYLAGIDDYKTLEDLKDSIPKK